MSSTVLKVVEVFSLVFVCVGASAGNIILFVLVAKIPQLQTKGNIFILNLAVADLLVALFNIPITIVAVISEDWILGDAFCKVSGFFTLLTFVASCMALTMISINRYHAIVHWSTYRNTYTRWKCVKYVAIVWGITIALSVPPLFGWAKFGFDKAQSYCFAEWSDSKSYTIFMIAACLFGPVVVMTYCYVKIFRFHKVTRKTVKMAAVSADSRDSSSGLAMEPKNPIPTRSASVKRRRKLTRTIVILIMVFMLCWSPFAIIMIVQVFTDAQVPRSIDFGSLVLGCLNSFFNVFVYNATNKRIRQGYKDFLRCKPITNPDENQPRRHYIVTELKN